MMHPTSGRMMRPASIRTVVSLCLVALVTVSGIAFATTTQAETTTLLILGDSITYGTEYFGKSESLIAQDAQWSTVVIDGRYSRRVAATTINLSTKHSGVKAFAKLVAEGRRPNAVIVALGSNDVAIETKEVIYEQVIRQLLNEIGAIPVVWVNVNRRDTPAIAKRSVVFNSVLARIAPEYPNLVIEDWYTKITKHPRWMAFDKIHLIPAGYAQRAKLYRNLASDLFARHIVATTPTTMTTTLPPETTTTVPVTVPPETTTTITATSTT